MHSKDQQSISQDGAFLRNSQWLNSANPFHQNSPPKHLIGCCISKIDNDNDNVAGGIQIDLKGTFTNGETSKTELSPETVSD